MAKRIKFNGKYYNLVYQTARKSFAKEYAEDTRKRGNYVRVVSVNGKYQVYKRVISSSTLKGRMARKRKK
tara:strand:+ start:57 stop:266 length:210 start_codon:yes stop_codon:yes gene_type:complete